MRCCVLLLLTLAATTVLTETTRGLSDMPDADLSQLKLDPDAENRLGELRNQIRRRQRVAPRGELAALYGELGMLYHAYAQSDPALTCYKNAASLSPDDFRWIYLAGIVHQDAHELAPAESAFQETLELNPGYAPAMRRLGDLALAAGRLEEAGYFYRQVLALLRHSPSALEGLGNIQLQRQQYARAIQLLESALSQAPNATRIHYALAMAYRGIGDTEKAKSHLVLRGDKKPGAHDPLMVEVTAKGSSAYTHVQRGLSAAQEEDYEKAAAEFAIAVNQDPENLDAQMALFDSLEKSGRPQEARTRLDIILQISPDHAIANYRKAQLLDQDGDSAGVLAHYQKAVDSDPGYIRARYYLANELMETGQYARAVPHYAILRDALSDDLQILYQLALASLASGDCAGALEPLEKARASNPRQILVLTALVRAASTCPHASASLREDALVLARELHANRPRPETTESLAMALAASGDFKEAVALQTRLVTVEATPHLEANLARYRTGRAARDPWPPDAPIYRIPPPVAPGNQTP